MGKRFRVQVQARAEALIAANGRDVAKVMGLPWPQPEVTVRVSASSSVPGSTNGLTITLGEWWFREHPDDDGCVLHELSHAYLRAPEYSSRTSWLIEGLADHVRDVLGFTMPWTFAHFEPGKATAGYQTTAHFLAWLEARWPGTVARLCARLADGSYEERAFQDLCDARLEALVAAYEADLGVAR